MLKRFVLLVLLPLLFFLLPSTTYAESTLIVLQAGDIGNIDNDQSVGAAKNALINIYDWGYVTFDTKEIEYRGNTVQIVDTTKLVPRIVESWETEILPDGRAKHIFNVRQGAVHHSGNRITAHDLAYFMYRRARVGRDLSFRTVTQLHTLEDYGSVFVPDDYTFVYISRQDMPLHLHPWTFHPLIDSKALINEAPIEEWKNEYRSYLARNPVAQGPFKLDSWTGNVEMVMVRNEDYWDPNYPKVDKLIWRVIPDVSTRILMLRRGDADIILDVPVEDLLDIENEPGINVLYAPSTNKVTIGMNLNEEPFNDLRVRKALSYAFPYQDVIEAVYLDRAQLLTGPIPRGIEHSFDEHIFSTDLNKAEELLADAGIPKGYAFPLYYSSANVSHETAAIFFQAQLRAIGYDLDLFSVPVGQFEAQRRERKLPMFFQEAMGWIQDAGYDLGQEYLSYSHNNYTGFSSAKADSLIEKINIETDLEKRNALIKETLEIVVENVPAIFVAQPDFALAMRDTIDGYVVQNTGLHHFWTVRKN